MDNVLRGLALFSTLFLVSCGVTYTSPTVKTQTNGTDVRVVALDSETVLVANRQPYSPKSLPDVFYFGAGRGFSRELQGAIPAPPYVPNENRKPLVLNAPPEISPRPYRIGAGDVVTLASKERPSTIEGVSGTLAAQNNRQDFTVRNDGSITIPNIGTVRLADLTLDEAEARLFQLMVENQLNPAFSLEVSGFNSKRISVGGAVGTPKLVPVSLTAINLSEAIAAAGGLAVKEEKFSSIRLYREGTLFQIPISDFFSKPYLQKTVLLDGDAIYVDTTYDLDKALSYYELQINAIVLRRSARVAALSELQTEISLRQQEIADQRSVFQDRLSLDAEKRDYVYLAGEVATQSRYTMPFGRQVSLADVVYDSGGFPTATGNAAHIYVLRPSTDPREFGAVTAWHLNAANAINITLATKLEMRPNDVVFIEEQPITKWGRALQQIFPSVIGAATGAISK